MLDESSPSEDDGDFDMARAGTETEPVFEISDLVTGSKPVLEAGESEVEPPPVLEEHEDMPFEKVADFEGDEEVEPPIVILQPKTISLPQSSDGSRKKKIKTLAGRTGLPLARQFLAMQAKATRKSFRIVVQSTQKSRKQGGSSKQSPPEIEEIVSSPEESSLRDQEITPEEQGPPESPTVRMQSMLNPLQNRPCQPSKNPLPKESYLANTLPPRAQLKSLLLSLVKKRPRNQPPQCPHPDLLSYSKKVWFGVKL